METTTTRTSTRTARLAVRGSLIITMLAGSLAWGVLAPTAAQASCFGPLSGCTVTTGGTSGGSGHISKFRFAY